MAKPVPPEDPEEWLEAHHARVPRVDLVAKAANGSPRFLMMKSEGLLDADTVRGLIAKSAPAAATTVTAVTGSPDDVAHAMHAIHRATQLQKAAETTPEENPMDPVLKADDAADAVEVVESDIVPDADAVSVEAEGDPDDPTTPAWEAVDAARARQALELVLALQAIVQQGTARETQELALGTGETDDVWALEDVLCSIDDIINTLAPFAVTEQAEADRLSSVMLKSGRVLSGTNQARIEGAIQALTEVLNTLPALVDIEPLAKEMNVETGLEKAKGDPLTPVYDESGKLVGMVNAEDLVPIASAAAPAVEEAAPAEEVAPAEEAAPAAPAEPAAEVQVPGTDTIQAPPVKPEEETTPITKAIQDAVTAALGEVLAPLVKQAGDNAGLNELVKGLQERVEHLSTMPDDRRSPLLGGGTGIAGSALRGGQDDVLAPLRKAVEDEQDPTKKMQARTALAHAAILQRFQQ